MRELIDYEGLVVDPDSGEIIEAPQGSDRMTMVAQRALMAGEQKRAWEQTERAMKAVLLKEQEGRRAVYGDVVVTVRQNMRREFDMDAFRVIFLGEELTRADMADLIQASKGFDPELATNTTTRKLIEAHQVQKASAVYVVAERVRKLAPIQKEEVKCRVRS